MNDHPSASPFIRDEEVFVRMTFPERLQHFALILSFVLLIVTGLPLLFIRLSPDSVTGFFIRGLFHRIAAVVLILTLLWEFLYAILTARGREMLRAIRPGFRDVRDGLQAFGHNLGFSEFLAGKGVGKRFFENHPYWRFAEPPAYDRYNFIEKFDFLAVIWGSVIMIVSGFFMWNVNLSLRLFPLWVHEICVLVHGYEAILAFLVIITWHMYNVHLNPDVFPMRRIWLDGKTTGRDLRKHHLLEYERIAAHRERAAQAIRPPADVPDDRDKSDKL
jgi:cytochrome b subunit of formate dehydrogenase